MEKNGKIRRLKKVSESGRSSKAWRRSAKCNWKNKRAVRTGVTYSPKEKKRRKEGDAKGGVATLRKKKRAGKGRKG